jgi:hypothetical protein
MAHLHTWEHLTTERAGDAATIRHGCTGCPDVMVTELTFKGMDVASVDVSAERRHFCPAPEHRAEWFCAEPACLTPYGALCGAHDTSAVRERLGGKWVE